ncbi:MAG: hypothetical protein ACRDA8_04430 [Shewanella sp.]
MRITLLMGCIALALAGCGGGDSDNESPPTPTPTKTGVFLDSAVAGLNYKTASIPAGVTNAKGEFNYRAGETVTFYIGELLLPSVSAAAQLTPAELGGGLNTATTVNILQLLQSLDQDANPANGISISDSAKNAFVGTGLDIASPTFDATVSAILNSIGKTLVSEASANAHFSGTLKAQLKGSWLYSEGAGKRNLLSFFDDKHYIIVHEHSDNGDQLAGSAEYGTYSYDLQANKLMLKVIRESDNSGGLCDKYGAATLDIKATANNLTLKVADGTTVAFDKVAPTTSPIVGAWLYTIKDPSTLAADDYRDNYNVLTILPNNEYAIVHSRDNFIDTSVFGEFAPYSYNGTTFTIGTPSVNADGDGGLSDIGGSAVVTVTDTELAFKAANGEAFSFTRIK